MVALSGRRDGRGLPRGVHARARVPPRHLPPRGDRRRDDRRRRRACGSRRPSTRIAPTPPPDIDVELWLRSIDLARGVGAGVAVPHALRAGSRTSAPSSTARARRCGGSSSGRGGDRRRSRSEYGASVRAGMDEDEAVRLQQAAPPEQQYLGLERYWASGRRRPPDGVRRRTIEMPRVGGPGSGLGDNWRVIVLNDNHNTFDGVAACARARHPRRHPRAGPRDREPDPQHRPGDRLVGPARAGGASTGSS